MNWFKYLWAGPNTLLGSIFLIGGKYEVVNGMIEITGPFARWFLDNFPLVKGAAAMTIGHVVIGQSRSMLAKCRSHEVVHVRQYETFGPFFIPLYFLCSFHAWRMGDHFYYDNYFEIEAYRKDGR